MKRLMLPLIAFVLFFALGSGGGAYLMKPPPGEISADSTADSTTADPTTADSTDADSAPTQEPAEDSSTSTAGATLTPHGDPSMPDSVALANDPHVADPTHSASVVSSGTGAPAAKPVGPKAPPGGSTLEALVRSQTGGTVTLWPDGTIGPVTAARDSEPDYTRMARLLSKMSPRDAARMLERLSGGQAAQTLTTMPDKQAALVLAQLAPEKAASLLQAMLALQPRMSAP